MMFQNATRFSLASLISLCAIFSSYAAAVGFAPPTKIFVDSSSLVVPDGLSWSSAFTKLQDALALADEGDTICVATGTYFPDEGSGQIDNAKGSTFNIPSEVRVYGGFPSGGAAFAMRDYLGNPTILSGDINQSGDTTANAYHVVTLDAVGLGTVLDGFTITLGNATTDGAFRFCGAGMLNVVTTSSDTSCASISYCTFQNNIANAGAGTYNLAENGGVNKPNYFGCVFEENIALTRDGGAMQNIANGSEFSYTLDSCIFRMNTAILGGGAIIEVGIDTGSINSTIDRTMFIDNYSAQDGGAISYRYDLGSVTADFNQTTFQDNRADVSGGAIILFTNDSTNSCSLSFDSSQFINNESTAVGGAIYFKSEKGTSSLDLHQTDFMQNYSLSSSGGGLYLQSITTSSVFTFDMDSCVFSGDTASMNGGAIVAEASLGKLNGAIDRCVFNDNKSKTGGAIYTLLDGTDGEITIAIDSCGFLANMAKVQGGAMYTAAGSGNMIDSISHTIFSNNEAVNGGGSISGVANNMGSNLSVTLDSVDFSNNKSTGSAGGAMHLVANSGSIDCSVNTVSFTQNQSSTQGGGIYGIANGENAVFNLSMNAVRFDTNRTLASTGGAVHLAANSGHVNCTTLGSVFDGNLGPANGGAISLSPNGLPSQIKFDVDSSEFRNNRSEFDGGAIYYSGANGEIYGTVSNSLFDRNTTLFSGGSIAFVTGVDSANIHPEIRSCIFSNGRAEFGGAIAATNYGGRIWPEVSQCLFHKDTADISGAFDIYSDGTGVTDPIITNCTFTKNVSTSSGAFGTDDLAGTVSPSIANSIFWDNENKAGFTSLDLKFSTSASVDFSIVDADNCDSLGSTVTCGDFMLYQQDPGFVDPMGDDFRLSSASNGINSGSNSAASDAGLMVDLAGMPRIEHLVVDLGVFESGIDCSQILQLSNFMIDPIVYSAAIQVKSNSQITHMGITEFQANESIDLIAGFEVLGGATFIADLDGCVEE